MRFFKGLLKVIGTIICIVIVIALGLLAFLSISEYNPKDIEQITIEGTAQGKLVELEKSFNIMSWNIGYGKFGAATDFVMDGGGNAEPASEEEVKENLQSIEKALKASESDIWMLQEVDQKSSRSYKIDEAKNLKLNQAAFALNYKCDFVPFPWPPFGYVRSGIYTTSNFDIAISQRRALPCTFSWPLKTANLKRCIQVSYCPILDSESKLVVINMHLEAYDDGEGRNAQFKQVCDLMKEEYEKGNYVIAGGDFNQNMPGCTEVYPNTHKDIWEVLEVPENFIPQGFKCVFDSEVPSCRLLNQPYNPADTHGTQHYVLDGFIVSPNVKVESVRNLDLGFKNSDHNPVKLTVTLENIS